MPSIYFVLFIQSLYNNFNNIYYTGLSLLSLIKCLTDQKSRRENSYFLLSLVIDGCSNH